MCPDRPSKKRAKGETMSKIYKALEKAERERAMEQKKDFFLAQEPEEEKIEQPESIYEPIYPEGMKPNCPLVTHFQPGSLGGEQFRKLRTHLLRLNILNPPKTIMVTSATDGEGKTFVAANLAAGIARELHSHALLVDCDLRSPSVAQWFCLQNGHGLSDYLTGGWELSKLLMNTGMERLSVLTAGSPRNKPTELIGSKKMETLVHELKSRYPDRYIIFDSTPLLITTEPEVLARLVDGMIIVVKAGVTPRETIQQAIAPLEKERILGFVLNYVQFKSSGLTSRYFGSGGYYYKYGYGKDREVPTNQRTKFLGAILKRK